MSIFNQYSYVILSLLILAVGLLAMRRLRTGWVATALVELGIMAMLVTGLFVLRPGSGDVDTVEAAQALLDNGKPTFLEFFSNYCAGCLSVRPLVDSIVEKVSDDFNILRIDIHTTAGRQLREDLGFSFTPEFVVFDKNGDEVWRDHFPPSDQDLQLALVQRN